MSKNFGWDSGNGIGEESSIGVWFGANKKIDIYACRESEKAIEHRIFKHTVQQSRFYFLSFRVWA